MCYGRIYKLTNLITGKCYVGQTTLSITERFSYHSRDSIKRHISASIRKYGKENFLVEEVCQAQTLEELNQLEIKYINQFNTMYPNGYNHREGGNFYGKHSEETKKRISSSKTGKPNYKKRGEVRTTEQRISISKSLGGSPIIGYNKETGHTLFLETAHAGRKYGFNPSNIVSVLNGRRSHSKGYIFHRTNIYANQNGSVESNDLTHVQRIGIETTNK